MSEYFFLSNGVKQGGILSSMLFFFKEDLFTSQINQQKNCNNNNNNNDLFTIDLATYGIADKIYNMWYIL